MYWASGPSGPLSSSLIGSVRFIWFKYRKRNFSGPPLGGLAKNKSKSDHFKWFDVCPDATPGGVHPRSIRFSGCTPARCIRSDRAARQGDILPDRRAPAGGNRALHILFTNELRGPGNNKGRMGGHKSQTDRMTSAILLSDVDVLTLYPNKQEPHAIKRKKRFYLFSLLYIATGPYQITIGPRCNISLNRIPRRHDKPHWSSNIVDPFHLSSK